MKLIKINFNEDGATKKQLEVIKQYNAMFDILLHLYIDYAKEYHPAASTASKHSPIKDLATLESWSRKNGVLPANYIAGLTAKDTFIDNVQRKVSAVFESKSGLFDSELRSLSLDLIETTLCALYRTTCNHGIRSFLMTTAEAYRVPTNLKYVIYTANATGLVNEYLVVDDIPHRDYSKMFVIDSKDMKEIFHITETTEDTFYADPVKKCIESDQDYLQPYLILKLNCDTTDYVAYDEIRYVEQCYSTIMYGPSYVGDDDNATNENCHCKMDIPCLHGPASVPAEITCGDDMHPFWVPTDKENHDVIKMPAGYGISSIQIKEYYTRGNVDNVKFKLQDNLDNTYTLIYTPTMSNVEVTVVAMPLLDAKIAYTPFVEGGLLWMSEDYNDWFASELYAEYPDRCVWGTMMYYQAPLELPEGNPANYTTEIDMNLIDIYKGDYDSVSNTFIWNPVDKTVATMKTIAMNPTFVLFSDDLSSGDGFVYLVRIKAGGLTLVNTASGRKYKCVSRQIYITTPPIELEDEHRYAYVFSKSELEQYTPWFIKRSKEVININSTACKCNEVAFDVFDTKSVTVTPVDQSDNTVGFRINTKMDLRRIKEYNPGRITALMYDATGRCIPATIYCIGTEEDYVEIRVLMRDEIKNRGITIIFPRGMVMDVTSDKTYISNEYILQLEYHDDNLTTGSFKEVNCDCDCCDDKKNGSRYNIDLTKFNGKYGAQLCFGTVNTWKFVCVVGIHGYEHREFKIGSVVPGDFRIVGKNGTVVGKCAKVLNYSIEPISNFALMYGQCDHRDTQILQFALEVNLSSNAIDEGPTKVLFDLGTIPGKGVSKMLISDATKPSGWAEVQPQTIEFTPREWRNR